MTLEEEKESFHLNCYNWSNDIFELKTNTYNITYNITFNNFYMKN